MTKIKKSKNENRINHVLSKSKIFFRIDRSSKRVDLYNLSSFYNNKPAILSPKIEEFKILLEIVKHFGLYAFRM